MSVNSVNGVEPQKNQHSVGAAIGTGVVTGLVGGGAGYLLGGKRPNLDEVFAMPKDKFEAATKDAEGEVKTAAEKIAAAREEYTNATATQLGELRTARAAKVNLLNSQTVDAALDTKVADAKAKLAAKEVTYDSKQLKKADVDTELTKALKDYEAADKVVKEAGESATDAQKQALKDAKEAKNAAFKKSKAFYQGAETEMKEYRDAIKERANARRTAYSESAKTATSDEAKALETIKTKNQAYTDAKKAKLDELKGKDEIKQAFEKIKKLFPKEGRNKVMWIAGSIAAAVGLIAGYMLSGKPAEAPQEAPQA